MNKHDNPQAFPHGNPTDGGDIGMTLRDYFAGQALNGFASQCDSTGTWSWMIEDAAIDAYRVADAMLAERERKP